MLDHWKLYRLYLVWGGDRLVCVPILICFIASIGVGIGALQGFARAPPIAPVLISELHDWIVSFFSLTLFTNFSCTSLIAARILWVHKRVSGVMVGGSSVFPAAMIIIESGMIYSACLIILLSLYLSGSFALYIVLNAVTQVIGVVFSLIIVRVGLGLSTDAATYTNQEFMSTFAAQAHANRQGNAYVSSETGGRERNLLHRNLPRRQRPIFTLTSTIGNRSAAETDTQESKLAVMSGGQTNTTFSMNSSSTHSGSTSTQKKGLIRPFSVGYLPEDDVGESGAKADAFVGMEESFHPFDEGVKRTFTEADRSVEEMSCKENTVASNH